MNNLKFVRHFFEVPPTDDVIPTVMEYFYKEAKATVGSWSDKEKIEYYLDHMAPSDHFNPSHFPGGLSSSSINDVIVMLRLSENGNMKEILEKSKDKIELRLQFAAGDFSGTPKETDVVSLIPTAKCFQFDYPEFVNRRNSIAYTKTMIFFKTIADPDKATFDFIRDCFGSIKNAIDNGTVTEETKISEFVIKTSTHLPESTITADILFELQTNSYMLNAMKEFGDTAKIVSRIIRERLTKTEVAGGTTRAEAIGTTRTEAAVHFLVTLPDEFKMASSWSLAKALPKLAQGRNSINLFLELNNLFYNLELDFPHAKKFGDLVDRTEVMAIALEVVIMHDSDVLEMHLVDMLGEKAEESFDKFGK